MTFENPPCSRCGDPVPCTVTAERKPVILCESCRPAMERVDWLNRRLRERLNDPPADPTSH